jgi:hypothetical protein
MLRFLFAGIVMLVTLPAAAELRIVQSGLTKPFPAIGDAVVGCRDPADTVHWIDIITGKIWERELVQDGQSQTLQSVSSRRGDWSTRVLPFIYRHRRLLGLRQRG